MNIQPRQLNAVKSIYPKVISSDCKVIAEAGNDNGKTFIGNFLVKVNGKHLRFEDGNLTKTINR